MASRAAGRLGADTLGQAGPLRLRVFFGLPLPDSHRRVLEPFLARCAALAPAFRWEPPDKLHLTVRFLGHVEQAVADAITGAVEAERPAAFELALDGLGTFKRGRLSRVVWLGLSQGIEPARELASLVEDRCRQAGLEPETRAFSAHLTLARARDRDGAPLPELGAPPVLAAWRAGELVLYRSRLGRGGSVYEPLKTISLR